MLDRSRADLDLFGGRYRGPGHAEADFCSGTSLAVQDQLSSHSLHAFSHSDESVVPDRQKGKLIGIEPGAIILNRKTTLVLFKVNIKLDLVGVPVPHGVVDGFPHNHQKFVDGFLAKLKSLSRNSAFDRDTKFFGYILGHLSQ